MCLQCHYIQSKWYAKFDYNLIIITDSYDCNEYLDQSLK